MERLQAYFREARQCWNSRKRYHHFEDMPDWVLVILGGASFLVAGYWGLALSDIVPEFIKIANKLCYIDAFGLGIGMLLLLLGIQLWFFGAIANRCNSILYNKWFK